MPIAPLWQALDRFLAGEIPRDELAASLDGDDGAARLLGDDERAALARPNDDRAALRAAAEIYERHRPGRLAHDRAERIARGMLAGEITPGAGMRALARLRGEGHDWIPEVFTLLVAHVDERSRAARGATPADGADALAERLAQLRSLDREYRAPALAGAKALLARLG